MNHHTDSDDAAWLHERLSDATPQPPPSPDRMSGLYRQRRQATRRRVAASALAVLVTIGGVSAAGATILEDSSGQSAPPVGQPTTIVSDSAAPHLTRTAAPVVAAPTLACHQGVRGSHDAGPATLPDAAVAALLCTNGGSLSVAPLDQLTENVDELVRTINALKPASPVDLNRGCFGPPGPSYLLLIAYPDGNERRVSLNLAGCDGNVYVGGVAKTDPDKPYDTFLALLRDQRESSTPPTTIPAAPTCLQPYTGSQIAAPDQMVAARLCVSYNEGASTTSVAVPTADLDLILHAWSTGGRSPQTKGPGCAPTVPTWVLSGVTAWGDPVAITAECDQPTDDATQTVVAISVSARNTVDRLVDEAGVQVDDGSKATTAWALAHAWLGAINARATVSSPSMRAQLAHTADNMWVRDPWLPATGLDWDLLAAAPTDVPGWRQAWRIPARTPQSEAVFIVVRNEKQDPWRILSLTH